nr:nickel-responsive transcriptional regulator NikR [Haematobacter sp.]
MQRVTMTIDAEQLATLDAYASARGYASRSEAMRDILREVEARQVAEEAEGNCFATLTYVYEHETRELARRLTAAQHDHHDLSVAALHVHVDHDDCLEVVVLKGATADVRAFADAVTTQRGVRAGSLHVIPATRHANPVASVSERGTSAGHVHVRPAAVEDSGKP